MSKTIAYDTVGECIILVHSEIEPSNDEWEEYVSYSKELSVTGKTSRLLIFSEGGAPNAKQRSMIAELFKEQKWPVAILTASRAARAVSTAVSWFYPGKMKPFSPSELDEAMSFLAVPDTDRKFIERALDMLRRSVKVIAVGAK